MTVMTPRIDPTSRLLAQQNDELRKENDALRATIREAHDILTIPDWFAEFSTPWLLVKTARVTLEGEVGW